MSLTSSGEGFSGGVRVNGVTRHIDTQVLSDRRLAGAEFGYRNETTGFLNKFENLLSTPDQPGSLSARLSEFESSLITASSRPDANERLEAAAWSARDLAIAINTASDGAQQARTQADRNIGTQVERLNEVLKSVERLNSQIISAGSNNGDTSSLQDQRQTLVDEISEMVPIRTVPRQKGAIAVDFR
ncbi:FlgK family flagellar hook-associated protein [Tateyamaria pelophila]|uniref:FlgK family flagellar hook-associated protein n=1 Tax=Tateyamaria pelophila TaxID=328415 RepID=UPI001CBF52F4|nr:hypothetical protein [Tateyamaria pelophila]